MVSMLDLLPRQPYLDVMLSKVFHRFKSEYVFCINTKLLLPRDDASSGSTYCYGHRRPGGRASGREGLLKVRLDQPPKLARNALIYNSSSPVGVQPKPENCVFVPIQCELRFHEAERSGRKSILSGSKLHPPQIDDTLHSRSSYPGIEFIVSCCSYERSRYSRSIPATGCCHG